MQRAVAGKVGGQASGMNPVFIMAETLCYRIFHFNIAFVERFVISIYVRNARSKA